MANKANQLFTVDFAGTLGAAWPLSAMRTVPSVAGITPRLDGKGRGIAGTQPIAIGYVWAGMAPFYPGRSNYKVDLEAQWKNPGGAGEREVGLIVRAKDGDNYLVARLKSMASSNPQLRLFKRVGGVETQLGATYSGAGLGSALLAGGIRFRVRVEDLADGTGNTRVTVYTESLGATGNGTSRIDYTGDLSELRGSFTAGVEVGRLWWNDDIRVDNLTAWDFADEWVPPAPNQGGTGWSVELGDTLYKVNDDTGQLEGVSPPVFLEWARQGYGPNGNSAALSTAAFTGGLVRPNCRVAVWYGSTKVFTGRVARGEQAAEPENEAQTWECRDAFFLGRQVILTEDNGTGVLNFNVEDKSADEYLADRQGMTIGAVLKFLFDRYTDGNEGLRFYDAAPHSGTAYVQSELDALDAVVPNLAVSNNFAAAVVQLLSYFPKCQVWVDPTDLVWHFRDVTALSPEVVSLTSEWASVRASPDPSRSFTAVKWRGAKPEPKAPTVYNFSTGGGEGQLRPAWTKAQEDNYNSGKRHLSQATCVILNAGNVSLPPAPDVPKGAIVYVDVAVSNNLDPDDFRGALATFSDDGYPRWCLGHTSTRLYFNLAWGGGTPPSVGSRVFLSLVDERAAAELSAQGVGRAFFLPPTIVCGYPSAAGAGFKAQGWCGTASVEADGNDGLVYSQEQAFKMAFRTAEQMAALPCDPTVTLAEKPKPPIGLINFFPPKGGSPPKPGCEGMGTFPQVRINLSVSEAELVAPSFREPATGYHGEAFALDAGVWDGAGEPAADDWGVRQVYVYDDPNYTSDSQTAGLRKAAQAILAVYGQRVYLFDVRLGTPWGKQDGQAGVVLDTVVSRWAGLFKCVSLTSGKRTTTFESAAFPTFEVTWNVRARTTTVRAGTAAGWLGIDAEALTRELREAAVDKKIGRAIQALEDYRNRALDKALKAMPKQGGGIDGCDVLVSDVVNKKSTTVQQKFEDDQQVTSQLSATLKTLNDLVLGNPKSVPGDTHAATDGVTGGLVIPGNGATLGKPVGHDIAFPGVPEGVPNADTSRYGGVPGVDDPAGGVPSRLTVRLGNVVFRSKHNADGRIIGIEGAPQGSGGAVPVGGWQPIATPADVYTLLAKPIVELPHPESVTGVLKRRDDGLAEQLKASHDAEGKPLAPGSTSAAFPDGAPPSLASWLRTPGHSRFFRMVPGTWGDPAGPVWQGPGQAGLWPARYWRVLVPENVLVEVENLGAGAGDNGGSWSPVVVNGANLYITDGYCVHKQAHGSDMEQDARFSGAGGIPDLPTPREPGMPFGFSADAWRYPSGVPVSGVGAAFALPSGGIAGSLFTLQWAEDSFAAAPDAAGTTHLFRIDTVWRASAWGAPTAGTPQAGTNDGTGATTGRFMAPGGAVPPGLRVPSDTVGGAVGVSAVYLGGTATNPPRLIGLGVTLAVIEGGYLVRIKEKVTRLTDVCVSAFPWSHQPLSLGEALVLAVEKPEAEGLTVSEGWAIELNPPVAEVEALTLEDSIGLLLF